jgi:ABC-2 type transport system permease protein
VLLWDVLFRGQLGVSLTFIEEMYSRNLGNLFVSPLRLHEFITGQLCLSVLRTLIGVGGACLFAWLLFRYSIFSMGLPLVAFFACLLAFGWAIGLAVSGMILRYGLGAEELAWAAIFLVAPVSGVYYPIAVLPPALQVVSYAMPPAHVFEGMRAVLLRQTFDVGHFRDALLLDAVYLAIGIALFALAVHSARNRGTLLQMGELEVGSESTFNRSNRSERSGTRKSSLTLLFVGWASSYSTISAAVTLRPSATRMLYVRHAARVSMTSRPTWAWCSGAVTRGCGKRCVAPVPSRTISGEPARNRSKSAASSASNPFAAKPGATASGVSTMFSR